jgi:hypothetical protein
VSVWVSSDDQECGACAMDGEFDAQSNTWSWSGTTPHGEMRSSYTFKDKDHGVETCYMKAADGSETKCMEIVRKRVKQPAAVEAAASRPTELGEEHQRLLKDVGEWQATVKLLAPNQEPTEDQATEVVTSICNGRWLWSDFSGQLMGMPFEGHALIGFDPKQKQYVSYWVDSMSPTWSQMLGTYDPAKKSYHMTGSSLDPAGQPMAVKEVITWKDDDTRIMRMEFKAGEESSTMEIAYKRKKKS